MELSANQNLSSRFSPKVAMTDIIFMRRAAKIAAKTQCWIGLGCVIVKDGGILAKGFNQTLAGEEYCQKFRDLHQDNSHTPKCQCQNKGCYRRELNLSGGKEIEKVCSIHAESQAIASAAKKGININKSAIYVTSFPCLVCLRLIIAAGIQKIFYMNDFYKPHHLKMLEKNGIDLEQIDEINVWKYKKGDS